MDSHRFAFVAFAGALALFSGCANSTGSSARRAKNANLGSLSSGATAGGAASDYSCPADDNVLPDYDPYLDGSGKYSACAHRSDASAVKLAGQASRGSGNRVCVFPVQVVDDSHWYVKPDLSTGRPLVQCQTLAGSEAIFRFAATQYNAVFVVEDPIGDPYHSQLHQMSDCLQAGRYASCPAFYSYGRFR